MDVVGLSKSGIDNVVANLGTSLTERQILTLGQFFNEVIICFDGDSSGYKAAIRAAENSIKELQPEKKISFLFLPDGEDPDSFVNKNNKDYFLEFTKKNKIEIHKFIFEHYYKETENNPSSMAIFEKRLREIGNTIKDQFIKKYILEYFLEKISSFTPNLSISNTKKQSFKAKTLKTTQKYFNESKSLTIVELKEYSILYIILKNIRLFKNNIHLLDHIKFFTNENKQILDKLQSNYKTSKEFKLDDLEIDNQLIEKILKFASIKNILNKYKNDEQKTIDLFMEVKRDLKNYELESRIEELEAKFSKDFSEQTFNELRDLKKSQKIN